LTVPARSTTRVVTDRFLPPRAVSPLIAAVLVMLLAAAATIINGHSHPQPAVPTGTGLRPLVVGDGRTVKLISLGGTDVDEVLARVASGMASAVAAVEEFWGLDWSRDIVVVATNSDAQFAAQAGIHDAGQRYDTAAVAVADRVDPVARTISGQRVVLAPGAKAMSDEALRIVLGHELFHYASRADTALDAPRWLTEGVADYVGRTAPVRPLRIGAPTALPSDAEFTGSPEQMSAAYDRAWLFARFVADRYGAQTLRRLYLRACGPGHVDVATALRETLGADPAAVTAQWLQWAASA
jgi:hypothetical protein